MKWRVAYLVFPVVAGLLLTVGNAWVCAYMWKPVLWSAPMRALSPSEASWPTRVPDGWGNPSRKQNIRSSVGQITRWYLYIPIPENDVIGALTENLVDVSEYGWPTPLMSSTQLINSEHGYGSKPDRAINPIFEPVGRAPTFLGYKPWNKILPTRILVGSFVIHWFATSLILSTPLTAINVRRMYRRRRNLCPSCAYNLAGLSSTITTCPECGKPVSPRGVSASAEAVQAPTTPL